MRRLFSFITISLIVFAVVQLAQGRSPADLLHPTGQDSQTSTGDDGEITTVPPEDDGRSIDVCLDPTASTRKAFATSIVASIVASVGRHVPPLPTVLKNGVTGIPGLELTLRLVSTRPMAYGEPYVRIVIPTIAGLPARPDMTEAGALDPDGPYSRWKELAATWTADYGSARQAQASGVASLQRIALFRPERSGVRDCAAALMSVKPTFPAVTVVVASDLEGNEFTGTDPDFGKAAVVLVQPCPDGNASACKRRDHEFTSWIRTHNAGPVTRARPEAAADEFDRLISTDD